jgi:antitoxin HicB
MEFFCKLELVDGMTLVSFPDLPNVQTYGDSKEEALFNAAEALNGSLASDVARGLLPPEPAFQAKSGYPIEVEPHILIAIQIRQLRGDLSQAEIAKRLGVTYQSYQLLENPVKGNPTIKSLERVAHVLGKQLKVQFA